MSVCHALPQSGSALPHILLYICLHLSWHLKLNMPQIYFLTFAVPTWSTSPDHTYPLLLSMHCVFHRTETYSNAAYPSNHIYIVSCRSQCVIDIKMSHVNSPFHYILLFTPATLFHSWALHTLLCFYDKQLNSWPYIPPIPLLAQCAYIPGSEHTLSMTGEVKRIRASSLNTFPASKTITLTPSSTQVKLITVWHH